MHKPNNENYGGGGTETHRNGVKLPLIRDNDSSGSSFMDYLSRLNKNTNGEKLASSDFILSYSDVTPMSNNKKSNKNAVGAGEAAMA